MAHNNGVLHLIQEAVRLALIPVKSISLKAIPRVTLSAWSSDDIRKAAGPRMHGDFDSSSTLEDTSVRGDTALVLITHS